jgi:hypothetical protein
MDIENSQEVQEPQNIEAPKISDVSFVKPPKKKVVKLVKKKPVEAIEKPESEVNLEESGKYINLLNEPKPKKPRTEGQIASFLKAQETRKANAAKRKEEMKLIAEHQQKELEKKILKKALSIKKREVRSRIALESIPDDDEPSDSVLAKVKAIQSKIPKPVVPPPPQYTFV